MALLGLGEDEWTQEGGAHVNAVLDSSPSLTHNRIDGRKRHTVLILSDLLVQTPEPFYRNFLYHYPAGPPWQDAPPPSS
jgi:hypothetical protein